MANCLLFSLTSLAPLASHCHLRACDCLQPGNRREHPHRDAVCVRGVHLLHLHWGPQGGRLDRRYPNVNHVRRHGLGANQGHLRRWWT